VRLGVWGLILGVCTISGRAASDPFLDQYCAACHNTKLKTGGVAFEGLPAAGAGQNADLWEKILRKVRTNEMPPAGAPVPAPQIRHEFVIQTEDALDQEAASNPNPGSPAVHRLNRSEYANAVRDLLGVQVDITSLLPPDDSGYGFDNIGDVLSLSPALLDRYISAARQVSELALSREASRRKVLVCDPTTKASESPCARSILTALARRAYRRPVTNADLKPLLGFFAAGRRKSDFVTGIQAALRALLVSPEFLLRVEHDPATSPSGTVHRISDLELASRLSFFLWGSISDEELLDQAEHGTLSDPAVLEHQVRRMLEDPRSEALVRNFAGQWLTLRNLTGAVRSSRLFPEFDKRLRDDFQCETELFVADIMREDRSVVDLLSANFTFLNERLARYYGISGVRGDEFRYVDLTDNRRGGLLGQGSILTVTSFPTRTSVVLRGKWILENLLGEPPPPPPPDVPSLPQPDDGRKPVSLREQMEAHRAQRACAACHAKMDALGFALENYDAVGKWRSTEAGEPIDASAQLPDGTSFVGPEGLKKALLDRRDEFIGAFTAKLMTFALGRGLEWYDQPALRKIGRAAERDRFRFSSIVLGIINSTPFQMRRTP